MSNSRVLVRTLNVFNGNYGGILQAYALQQAIGSIGHEVWTDYSYPQGRLSRPAQRALSLTARLFPIRTVQARWDEDSRNQRLNDFVRKNIRLYDLYGGRRTPSARSLDSFDTFLVGSDQVWRREYGDLPSFFLDFLAGGHANRVAYAASFGHDSLAGYSLAEQEMAQRLLAEFAGVSVRESSGVDICRDLLGIEAHQVLDPTLLLTKDHYADLVGQRKPGKERQPYLYTYILDESSTKNELVKKLAKREGLEIRSALPSNSNDCPPSPKPGVESWLEGFMNADMVVTDSFHGTVFSILFERPFVPMVNRGRGAARFSSLFADFGLTELDVYEASSLQVVRPDWSAVRGILGWRRQGSLEYLARVLDPSAPARNS